MNKMYKSLRNGALGAYVVVSEHAATRGKRSGRVARVVLTAATLAGAATSASAAVSLDGGNASGGTAIAIGSGSSAGSVNDSVAIGSSVVSNNADAISIGSQITNDAASSVVIGSNFVVLDSNSTQSVLLAPNGGTVTNSANSFTFSPNGGTSTSNSNDSINLGGTATNASGGVALGSKATVSAANAVALGAGSVADTTNSVSVGSASLQRTITNVKAGVMDTDAATVGQLRASGLVDASGEALDALTYDAGSSRASVTLAGIGGTLITNVKAGELSADSTDAVNGAQLFALAGDTSNVYIESNGSGVKYARTNDNNLAPEDAHAQGVGSTAVGYNAIASASDALALGRGAQASFADSVALGAGSRTTVGAQANYAAYGLAATQSSAGEVNVGNRQITGVAAGSADTDAVNVAQLKGVDAKIDDVSAVVASVANSAVKYDDASQSKVTLGGADGSHGPVTIANVANGTVSADSKEAINGSQLFELQNSVTNTIASAAHSPFVAADGNRETEAAKASGTHATALGANASAAGNNGTALGAGAKASNDNAVALGANSTTDRANSVSVGSEGNERQITNVAAGTQPNDAVNFSQLQGNVASGVANANAYTDSRVNQVRRDSFAGVAAAMAIAGLPASSLPGRGMVAVAGSNYRGESAVAMGVSALSESGKIAVKITGTTDGHGEYGVTAGAGVHW